MRNAITGLVAVLSTVGALLASTPGRAQASTAPVVLIMMENESYSNIVGNTADAPFETMMAQKGLNATNAFDVVPGSKPNYIAITSGMNVKHQTGTFSFDNLFNQLATNAISERAYMETMPSACYLNSMFGTAPAQYWRSHDPVPWYKDIINNSTLCKASLIPAGTATNSTSQLLGDAQSGSLAAFNFVTPNTCNDQHSCSIATGDQWLSNVVPTLVGGGAIVVLTWDEGSGNAHIPLIEYSPGIVASGTYTPVLNHYNVLAGLEDYFGRPRLGGAIGLTPFPIGASSPPPAPTVTGFNPTSGPVGQSVAVSGTGFTGATSVSFASTSQTLLTVNSDTSITAKVPSGASGIGPICVTRSGGMGCSSTNFTVTVPSAIQRVARIGTATTTLTSSPTSLSITVGASGVPAGDTVMLGVAAQGVLTPSATDSTGVNAYHLDVSRPYSGTGPCTSALLTSKLTHSLSSGQTITVTIGSRANAWGFVADDWTGLSGSVDKTGAADSGGVTSTTPSASTSGATSQANEAVIGVTCTGGNPTITPGSGYTLSAGLKIAGSSSKRGLGDEFKTVSATGTQTATFMLSVAQHWSAVIGTYG